LNLQTIPTVKKTRGKKVVILSAVLAIAVLGTAVLEFRTLPQELWHLYKLESGDESEKVNAFEKLEALRSVRALPVFIRMIEAEAGAVDQVKNLFEVTVPAFNTAERAVIALGRMGPRVQEKFLRLQDSWSPETRAWFVEQAVRSSETKRNLVPVFIFYLDEYWEASRQCIRALKEIATDAQADPLQAPPIVDALVRALKNFDSGTRRGAAEALKEMAPLARAAVRDLAAAMKDIDGGVRAEAAMALVEMSDIALPHLLAMLHSEDRGPENDTFIMALWAVGQIGPKALGALPVLLDTIEDGHRGCRNFAIEALGKMGRDALGAVRILWKIYFMDESNQVAETAARALKRIKRAFLADF
jgi:hypothetical protein